MHALFYARGRWCSLDPWQQSGRWSHRVADPSRSFVEGLRAMLGRQKKKIKPKAAKKKAASKGGASDGENSEQKKQTLTRRVLIAFAPIIIPVGYACVFIPLNNLMAGEPVSEAQILQTLMGMWLAIISIAFLTDPTLFFPSLKEFNIRWSFPVIIALLMMLTRMLFTMYISVGPDECILDTNWEFPEPDPLSETGWAETENQVIGPGFYFFGLHRIEAFKRYNFKTEKEADSAALGEDRIFQVNVSRAFTLTDDKTRTFDIASKLTVACPIDLYRNALGSSLEDAFVKFINEMEDDVQDRPPQDDVWTTMSSTIYERELTTLLSNVMMEHLKFAFENYGLPMFSFKLKIKSAI